jgi:hypothetical protein
MLNIAPQSLEYPQISEHRQIHEIPANKDPLHPTPINTPNPEPRAYWLNDSV